MRWFLAAMLMVATLPVVAASCGTPGGANIFNKRDGGGYVMDLYLAKRDVRFSFPGASFRQDPKAPPGKFSFFVDDIYYQVLTTPVEPVLAGKPRPDDATLLAQHMAWEIDYYKQAAKPTGTIENLGVQRLDGRPMQMLVWRRAGIGAAHGMQYWVTTVVDDDIVVLTAILPQGQVQDGTFRAFLADYSGSFSFLPTCPPAGR